MILQIKSQGLYESIQKKKNNHYQAQKTKM